MRLSILIPTIQERESMLYKLLRELRQQIDESGHKDEIEIIIKKGSKSIGYKRNELLSDSKGEYVCFVDDDDFVSSIYIKELLSAIEKQPDCVSLRGVITWDGQNPELFEHSIKYSMYATTTNPIKYERYPNHLNAIKASIAKRFKFPEINHGEDTDWATQINESGLLKNEIFIDKVLYHYNYVSKK